MFMQELWVRFACAALAGGQSEERTVEDDVRLACEFADRMLAAYEKRFRGNAEPAGDAG